MNVLVFDHQDDLTIDTKAVKPIVEKVLALEKVSSDEVSVYFVSTEEICRLHKEFFDDPSPTDCISFPMDLKEDKADHHILGEVFVCPKTAIDYVGAPGGEVYHETTLYLVHGLLHLMGYDDIDDAEEMRAAEKTHLKNLIQSGSLLINS
ncbi:MAG: Endoribonuclease YbeY [Chlamydiae bacterium]|nr:Endoribonuclease YbeY [Chlamydiota bacterium]